MTKPEPTPDELVRVSTYLARRATDLGIQAGVGAMETAGAFVSYIAANPERVQAFLTGGAADMPLRLHVAGCLSWHGMDGKIHWPSDIRAKEAGHHGH